MATSCPLASKRFLLLWASLLTVLLTHSGLGLTAPAHKARTGISNSSKPTSVALSSFNLRPNMYSVSKTNQMSSSSAKAAEFMRGDEDSDPHSELKSTASPAPSSEYVPDARPENDATSEPSKHGPDPYPEAETWPESRSSPISEYGPDARPENDATSEPSKHGPDPYPEAETWPESRSSPISEYEPNARPENEGTSEPSKHGPDPYPEAETWPEPGPRWEGAFNDWKWAWPFHVYLFATMFLFIGFYSGYYVVFNLYDGLQGKYLSVSLNAMALLFGMSRAFVLFFDPYHQGQLIDSLLLMRLLWSIGGPCLTAADSLIIFALVETAKVSLGPPRFQKLGIISGIIAFHFAFVLATDVVVSTYMEAKAMILFCQLFFSVWGVVLGLGYIVLARKLDKKLFSHKEVKDKQDKVYIFLVYASGAANLLIVGIMFYTAVGPFGIYSDLEFVDAWHWYTLQTLFRGSEVITCILVFTVSAKRSRVKRAVEELESTVSQATESSSDLNVTKRLRGLWGRLKRTNRVTPDDTIDENEEEMLRAAWLGRKPSSPISKPMELNGVTLPNQPIPSRRPRAGRRQSLFSAMQDASVTSTLNNNVISTGRTRRQNVINPALLNAPVGQSSALKVPAHGSRRKRRLSLFSAMQEASISSTLSENIITTGRTRRETNSAVHQSDSPVSLQVETRQICPVPVEGAVTALTPELGRGQRERRRSIFSALQENNGNNDVLSHTLVEEDGEEEECEERRKPNRPSALLERDGSLRNVFRRIAGLIQQRHVVVPATAPSETIEEGQRETVKVEVDSPSVSTISL